MNNLPIIMSKKIFLFFFFLQLTAILAQEQNLKVELASTQKTDADVFVGFGGVGNLYYLKNDVFYSQNKKESWQYKNVSLGQPTKIDIQNPLKIMLFYDNFNTVIMLDNQLNEIQKINFSEKDVPIVAAAAGNASQNRLWIYNSLTQQIGLFDFLKNTFQSITPSIQGNLKHYQSDFTKFHWIDTELNWYSCDVYGKITSLGEISNVDQIQIVDSKELIFMKDGSLFLQDVKKSIIYPIENVEKSFTNFFYKDQILSIFTNQEITNYKIAKP